MPISKCFEGIPFYGSELRTRGVAFLISKALPLALIGGLSFGASSFSQPTEDTAEPDFSLAPGNVIAYSPARSGIYLGSPGIVVLEDGSYLAKHDEFGPKSTENTVAITHVYRSEDRGESWTAISRVEGMYWATIFSHKGAVYLMGTSRQNGNAVIMKSQDQGATWSQPLDGDSGLLLSGDGYHCAPVPIVEHQGRLWRAMEDTRGPGGRWGLYFRALMMSAPVDADLLKADSWTVSNRLERNPLWLDEKFGGFLEGNAVVDPNGQIVNILRAHFLPEGGKAAIARVSEDGRWIAMNAENGFIDFPGGSKKFTIRWDANSGHYWSLSNWVPNGYESNNPSQTRNTLALVASRDLKNWEVRSVIIHDPVRENHGYQYVDWLFDGADMIAAVRTAHEDGLGGAHNQHDSNFMTFHRIENFRELNWKSAPAKFWGQLKSHPVRVACVGDSITFGAGVEDRENNSYPAQLQNMLGDGFDVRNFGVSGATMLKDGDYSYWDRSAFTHTVQFDPDIVFIKLGTNDTKPQNWRYADRFENDYRSMIRYFKSLPTNPRVVICLPVPVMQDRWGINEPALVNEMMPMLHRLIESEGVDFVDLYSALKPYPEYFPDFIHPNAAGAKVMAEQVAKYFQ